MLIVIIVLFSLQPAFDNINNQIKLQDANVNEQEEEETWTKAAGLVAAINASVK